MYNAVLVINTNTAIDSMPIAIPSHRARYGPYYGPSTKKITRDLTREKSEKKNIYFI